MNLTIRQQTIIRGRNDLMKAANRNIDRSGFRNDVAFFVVAIGLIAILWS